MDEKRNSRKHFAAERDNAVAARLLHGSARSTVMKRRHNPPQRPAGMQQMGEQIYAQIRQLVRELSRPLVVARPRGI